VVLWCVLGSSLVVATLQRRQLSDSDLLNCFVATHCDMSDVDPNEVGDNWSLEWDAVNSCKFYYNS
jgi:hypothetical protein